MEKTFKSALEHAISETGRSLRSVAMQADVSYDLLKNLRQGKAQTTNVDDARKVANAFGVTLDEFYNGKFAPELEVSLPVAGRVGAGARVPLYDATDEGGLFRVVIPHQLRRFATGNHLAAVEVEGDSMQPMYQPGDLLFFSRASHEAPLTEDIGRPCVIEDADGMAWVKQLKTGDEPGLYHLISLNPGAQTRHNQRIRWASRILMALPTELVDRA